MKSFYSSFGRKRGGQPEPINEFCEIFGQVVVPLVTEETEFTPKNRAIETNE
jgi:hypothetical protein